MHETQCGPLRVHRMNRKAWFGVLTRWRSENDEERMKNVEGEMLHGNNFSKQIRKREKCLRGWTPFFSTSSPIYSKIGEVVAAQLAQASSARPGGPVCFLQKQQAFGGIFWRAQAGLGALCTPIFTKYTPLCFFFGDSFFVKLWKLTNFVTILVFFP